MKYRDLLIETRIYNIDDWKWDDKEITNFFIRLIKDAIKDKSNISKVPNNLLKTDWDKKDNENGTLVLFTPNNDTKNKFSHITDWLDDMPNVPYQQLRGIQNLNIAYEHANRYFAAKNKNATDIEEEEGREIVYKFKDGMFFTKLNSSQCLDREGKLMQHCVGSYAAKVKEGQVVIYSLRDKKNQPHATLEVKGKDIHQIKGKQNDAPIKKYIPYIREFILKNNFNVIRDYGNIGLLRLNKKLYDMYEVSTWPTKIEESLFLSNTQITSLPDDLNIKGSLYLNLTSITSLPNNLHVHRDLDISNTTINSLPNDLIVGGILYCLDTPIKSLPDKLKVGGGINLSGSEIISLPDNLIVNRYLDLSNTHISSLPNNLVVKEYLDICNTSISSLPDNLIVHGSINLSRTPIKILPNNLQVGDGINLSGSEIISLPDNLEVAGNLYLSNTKLTSLPNNLKIGKNLYISRTPISSLPKDLQVGGEIIGFERKYKFLPEKKRENVNYYLNQNKLDI